MTKFDLDLNEKVKFKHIFTGKGYSQMTFFWKSDKKNSYFFGKDYDSEGIKNFAKLGWMRKGRNSDTKVRSKIIGGENNGRGLLFFKIFVMNLWASLAYLSLLLCI